MLRGMVVRRRIRSVLFSLALWAFSGGVVTYFVRHASMGDRGLTAKLAYVQQMQDISVQLDAAKAERADLELRVHQFQNGSVDHDLLDEEARRLLGRAHPNELLVDLPQPRG